MGKLRFATVWLGGCSGCHMSFLDTDEWLLELAGKVEVVFSPLADVKEYPSGVDLVLVEGAIATEDHVELVHRIRKSSRIVVSLGDCAVTGNVTALRNPLGPAEEILQRVYVEYADETRALPRQQGILPTLIDKVVPVHALIPVDVFLPGCPPPAPRIRALLEQLLAGQPPRVEGRAMIKFG